MIGTLKLSNSVMSEFFPPRATVLVQRGVPSHGCSPSLWFGAVVRRRKPVGHGLGRGVQRTYEHPMPPMPGPSLLLPWLGTHLQV